MKQILYEYSKCYFLCELMCLINCLGYWICFVFYTFNVQRLYHIFYFIVHMHMHHVEPLSVT